MRVGDLRRDAAQLGVLHLLRIEAGFLAREKFVLKLVFQNGEALRLDRSCLRCLHAFPSLAWFEAFRPF